MMVGRDLARSRAPSPHALGEVRLSVKNLSASGHAGPHSRAATEASIQALPVSCSTA